MKWKYGMLTLLGLLLFGGVWGQPCSSNPSISGRNKTEYCRGDLVIISGTNLVGSDYSYNLNNGGQNPTYIEPIYPFLATSSELRFVVPTDVPDNNLMVFTIKDTTCNQNQGTDSESIPINGVNLIYSDTLFCTSSPLALSPPTVFPSTTSLSSLTFSSMAGHFTVDASGLVTIPGTSSGLDTLEIITSDTNCPVTKVPFDIRNSININLLAPGSPYCEGDASTQVIQATSDFPGSFSVFSGNLTLFQDSLLVPANNPVGSSVVMYTATYGNCTNSNTVSVEIEPVEQASGVYPNFVCEGAPTVAPLPNHNVLSFDALVTNGGAVLNTSTGVITLNNATDTLEVHVTTIAGTNTCSGPDVVKIPIQSLEDSDFSIPRYLCQSQGLTATGLNSSIGDFYVYAIATIYGPYSRNSFGSTQVIPGVDTLSAGNYILEYQSSGACPTATQKLFTVTVPDSASISYPTDTICPNTSPSPQINLNPGGTFSSNGGLAIDVASGTLYPTGANGDSTYMITFQSLDTVCPAFEDTFFVHVKAYGVVDIDYQLAFACNDTTLLDPNVVGDPGTFVSLTAPNLFLEIDSVSGFVDPAMSDPGVHAIFFETYGNCQSSTVVNLEIVERDDAEFSYMGDPFCTGPVQIVSPTPTAFLGDTFTTTFANVVHPDSGWVYLDVLANSISPNDSSVTAMIKRETSGRCPDSFDTTITVFKGASALFSYAEDAHCTTDTTLFPNFSASALGIFTASPLGIVWVDSADGSIDLGQSLPGSYQIVKDIDLGQCSDSDTFSLVIEAPGSVVAQYEVVDSSFVNGDTVQYCQNYAEDPQAIVNPSTVSATFQNYLSPNDSIVFSIPNLGVIDLDSSGVGVHGILVTLNSVCEEQDTAWVEILPPGNADFGFSSGPIVCQSTELDTALIVDPNASGIFEDLSGGLALDTASGVIDLTGVSPGLYTVRFTTSGKCFSMEDRELRILDTPEIELEEYDTTEIFYCEGDSVEFNYDPGLPSTSFGYLRRDCKTTFDNISYAVCGFSSGILPDTGQVFLESSFVYGFQGNELACTVLDTVQLIQKPFPTFLASPDSAITTYEASPFDLTLLPSADETEFTVVFDSVNALNLNLASYNFDTLIPFGGTPFSILRNFTLEKPTTPGVIFAYIETEAKGCPGMKDTIRYNIQPNDFPIYIPEVFTPDGKGDQNDTWKVQCNKEFIEPDDYRIEVYNRAGGKVYDMNNLHPNWEGTTNNGSPLPDGVYWWTLIDKTTKEVVNAGGVTIRRK